MADNTPIEWSDATWNPITGCSVISPGCTNCYAMRLAGTRMKTHPSRAGLTIDTKAGPVWNGQVRFNEQWLTQPLQWKRPRMIFVCAHADLFHEAVPDEWIDRVFAVMALAPHHQFQVLTKRSKRMRQYMRANPGIRIRSAMQPIWRQAIIEMVWPLPNVWLGVSAEDQRRADERIPDLLATPAAIRWLSAEPLLGPIELDDGWIDRGCCQGTSGIACPACPDTTGKPYPYVLDWVVAGGESGPGARPMHPDWARSLRDQCAAAGVPFLFKQWGNWAPAPWRVSPKNHEPAKAYITRSEGTCATHAIAPGGHLMALDHKPWSIERTGSPEPHAGLRHAGKKAAGRLLDGIKHNGFPVVGGGHEPI